MPGIDPFLMQLFIVPAVVIGVGVFVASLTKKVVLAPVVTLLLNLLYEIWYAKYYYSMMRSISVLGISSYLSSHSESLGSSSL